ncbi:alpha/beta hydrolase family protein [Marinimicrobium agarilyticum]|uniref:alpha/beta hydrolase family protein n=1 Tax=Marinimicrobium agarilyticum TaxID=306546 RepID=UPI000417F087|nr:S9 family peptidase [Marinimicrobium agarilyticum]
MEQHTRHFLDFTPSTKSHLSKPFKTLLVVVSLAFCVLQANAAENAKQVAERYGADAAREMVTISPNGTAIALRSRSEKGDFVLVHSLVDNKMITGANVSEINPKHLYFLTDQKLIMIASEEKRLRGFNVTHMEISTAYVLDLKTGDIEQLLRPGDVIWKAQSGLGRVSGVSKDRKTLYMPAYTGRNRQDRDPDLALLAVDIENPRSPKVLEPGHSHTIDYYVNDKGDVLAEIRYDQEAHRLYVVVPENGGGDRTIYSEKDANLITQFAGLTKDMKSLLAIRSNKNTGEGNYFKLSLSDGSEQELHLGRDDVDIEDVFLGLDRVAVGIRFGGFTPQYHLFDSDASRRLKALQNQLEGHAVELSSLSEDNKHIVINVQGNSTAGDYYLATEGQPLRYLTSNHPQIPEGGVNPTVQIEYETRDGLKIPTLLTLPQAKVDNPKNLPTVIYPHGGPHTYDRVGYDGFVQAMAARGYAVVQPQFRGSTGFGIDHWKAGQGEWGRGMQDDLTDAVRYLTEAGLTDAERVCIVGGSYGGYAALAGAAFTPTVYRCAVSINGVSDLTSMMEHDEEKFEESDWVYEYLTRSVAKDFFTPERIAAYSPANFAGGIKTPILLIHGEDDKRVPVEQSELMAENLRKADKAVEFVRLKEAGHNLWKEESRVKALSEVLKFLDQHLATAE